MGIWGGGHWCGFRTGPTTQFPATQTYPTGVPAAAEVNKYLKIEAVGRSGQINPADPTTYGNSDAPAQRVELVAYKSIGINEFVRQITNRDNKPGEVTLGAPFPVYDHDQPPTFYRATLSPFTMARCA